MKKYKIILNLIYLVSITTLFILVFSKKENEEEKKLYVIDNAKVFSSFQMKKDFDVKIENDLKNEKEILEVLDKKIKLGGKDELVNKKEFQITSQNLSQKFEQLSSKYTNEVYLRLNEYIKEYAEKNNCSLILGSNGQGNVMYLGKEVDVTEKLIKFINDKYSN